MNSINLAVDWFTWAVGAVHRMDAPALACVKELKINVAIRDAIRYAGPGKIARNPEYRIINSICEEEERHFKHWMQYLKVEGME